MTNLKKFFWRENWLLSGFKVASEIVFKRLLSGFKVASEIVFK
jgi:hypothetical protein